MSEIHIVTMDYIGDVKDMNINSILNHNKKMVECFEPAHGRGSLTCGKPYLDHHGLNIPTARKCCGYKI